MKLSKITKTWFTHEDSEFEIQELLTGDINEITEKTSNNGMSLDENGGVVRAFSSNKTKNQEMTICKSIVAWKNVNDENGEPLECNDKNKIRFCREQRQDDFDKFVTAFIGWREKLSEKIAEQREKSEKN